MTRIAGQRAGRRTPGLLAPGMPVNRDTLELAIERAAMSCARGPVQAAVVQYLIENGSIEAEMVYPSYARSGMIEFPFSIAWSSWKNLQARLEAAGFAFRQVRTKFNRGAAIGWRWDVYWGEVPNGHQ